MRKPILSALAIFFVCSPIFAQAASQNETQLVKQTIAVGKFTVTQYNFASAVAVNSTNSDGSSNKCDPGAEFLAAPQGGYQADAASGCIAEPDNSTVIGAAGVAGYATTKCNSKGRTICNAEGGYFQGRALADYSAAWGANPLVTDVAGISHHHMTGMEIDANVKGSPDWFWGLLVTGLPPTGTMPASSWGISVDLPGVQTGIQVGDGTVNGYGLILGSQHGSANSTSQYECWNFRDSLNVAHCSNIYSDSLGTLHLSPYRSMVSDQSFYLAAGKSLASGSSNVSNSGTIRLAAGDSIGWCNAANQGDVILTKNSDDQVGTPSGTFCATGNDGICQTKRISGCMTAASLNATCDATVTWTHPFHDANYTVICTGDGAAGGVPLVEGIDMSATKTASTITVRTISLTAAASGYAAINCSAIHD